MLTAYEILGVNVNASDEEIKNAYRILAKKYSNEIYQNGPLADAAKNKMQELNNAYDEIMLGRTSVGTANNYTEYKTAESSCSSRSQNTQFGDIRAKLNSGRIDDAEILLDGVPKVKRDAEWYFLKGTVMHRRGWLDEASKNFNTAYSMEPDNVEYKAARDNCEFNKQGKYNKKSDNSCSCSPCSLCSTLMIADFCCSALRCCSK